ncbi:E3 ubiquitin-protein ligase UBR2-like isoform X1 [Limulus polyphemus]|uniref:E3 ubiquitin-protein ligase n=2 Tax=Limulus polyphemus TaxID=6850 RepID=A0ABM1SKX4_LIMPO|nr:E3 ubiquitin-protein ligase UBR2-like isoform X1 [Limulus polyphemus]
MYTTELTMEEEGSFLHMTAPTFHSSVDFTVHDWLKKFNATSLKPPDFREYWALNVPNIYSPRADMNCLNITFDEGLAKQVLFTPLERFICGCNETEKVFEEIKKIDSLPMLCGRVFKSREPTYSCRDCALDPTCVLCMDCFKNSAHNTHRYKMSMSGGGGYCDCGDEEAWKAHAYCEVHLQGKREMSSDSSPIERLPLDLIERIRILMGFVLSYCHEMLTWEQPISQPSDLCPSGFDTANEAHETYATMLFNDEIHTYDQVIHTLNRAIECTEKEATDYATMIDREGRSIVKCGNFQSCNQVRNIIERTNSRSGRKPLRVVVMHSSVIAHQIFAMKLLSWLKQILSYSEAFRIIFSQVMMESPTPGSPLLESIMLSDTQLWKAARNQWHQLFISGTLMDQQCKKTFARIFTHNYPLLMKDFIADDHEHSVSITSLSVQIFTVPTLAHYLIMEENAIYVLLRTFLTECERNRIDGKLSFERSQNIELFRRSQFVLFDLRYLLTVKPNEWNTSLRKNFLHGIQQLLNFLSWMQGMDSVVRQVGQHVEFEAEWETGVNLQSKLVPVITLVLDWCGSDRVVLVKALRAALKLLESIQGKMTTTVREVADHSSSCIEYDVSSMPVTIHLPLSRFVAGLILHLPKFDLTYSSPEFLIRNKPGPEELMELPLRTQVMIAQFRAGMWRRNGYSLLNQVFFYHNVRLRDEMLDRDIMMLQIAASLMESNKFLIHLLNKYGLLIWIGDTFDTSQRRTEDEYTRQTATIAEEFLGLLIIIISERYYPGVGNVTERDRVKKEIIQLLCIEPMTNSQLCKMLPKDPNHETGMENVVNEVADLKKTTDTSTGKYELKPEFYSCFNPFFYHYTREEQSKAEEVQLKRKKQTGEEECCPPPLPSEFSLPFSVIINLLQCDVMAHIMLVVLKRTLNLHSTSYSEGQFEKVLHIIGLALHEEQRQQEQKEEGGFFQFTKMAEKKGILADLEKCQGSPRVEAHKDLLNWTLRKFRSLQRSEGKAMEVDVEFPPENTASTSRKRDKKQNAQQAAARRARIMAQMSAMQKNFIKQHAQLLKEVDAEESSNQTESDIFVLEESSDDPVALGNLQRGKVISRQTHTCILCREEQEASLTGRTLVIGAFVQRSTVLSKNRNHRLEDPKEFNPLLISADLFCGPHTSTCGHVMHSDCWQKFFEAVVAKERRRPVRYGRHVSFNVDKQEFLCPLCECLCNTVIPLVPPITTLIVNNTEKPNNIKIDDWLFSHRKAVEKLQVQRFRALPSNDDQGEKILYRYKPTPLKEVMASLSTDSSEQFHSLYAVYAQQCAAGNNFPNSLLDMMRVFSQATYMVGLEAHPNPDDDRVPLMTWWSCAYTIHSIEWLLRDQKKSLFGDLSSRRAHCMQTLVRVVGASTSIFDAQVVRNHCVSLLQYLLLAEEHSCSSSCCLEVDAFTLLVFVCLSMPVLFTADDHESNSGLTFPVGGVNELYILHLVLVFHLVQIFLSIDFPFLEEAETSEAQHKETSEEVAVCHFYIEVLTAAGVENCKNPVNAQKLLKTIHQAMLPFLRCSALFFHFLTDVEAPKTLAGMHSEEYQFQALCWYLGLSTRLNEILQSPSLRQLALCWARHAQVYSMVNQETLQMDEEDAPPPRSIVVKHPISINQLVCLPSDYSELINNVSVFTCPNSDGEDSRSPTMCLVCGQILCSQSYCCQTELEGAMVGACTFHVQVCGAGVGIFLRIRDCKILLLVGKTKGCYMPPPYVDEYGETDQGLVRGNPLHLCKDKYRELHRLWLSHGIPEQVSHTLEQLPALTTTNWFLL